MRSVMKILAAQALLALVLFMGARAESGASAFGKTQRVCVSTEPTTPTTIVSANQYAARTTLVNGTTNYIMIGDADTTFSTSDSTGTFRLPASTSFSPDGVNRPWQGKLRGVSSGSGCVTIDVIQSQ